MDAPVCLIDTLPDGKLCVQSKALQILSQLEEPVVVVSVVGLYRTGKSYLMNRLAGSDKGFALGSTVESKTKGIWMWCLKHPTKPGTSLVLLDTEGLGDVDKGDSKHDTKIFSLAVLLSSILVLNTRGTIDNRTIEELQYVTELTEYIKIKSSEPDGDDSEFIKFFPGFVWAVRDFTLEQKINGKSLTDDQYLELALKLKPGLLKAVREYNLPRACIRNYFPSRKCFTFPFPCAPEQVRLLESLNSSELSPEFLQVTQSFCEFLFEKGDVKKLKDGQTVTGRVMAHLVKTYADALSSGEVPFLENAVIALAQIENDAAVKEAHDVYQRGMEKLKDSFPLGHPEISSEHHTLSSKATQAFIKRSFKDTDGTYFKAMEDCVNKLFDGYLSQNENASKEMCEHILSDLSEMMKERIKSGDYSEPGGYSLYSQDMEHIVRKYKAHSGKGVMAEDTLKAFLKQKSVQSKAILQADMKLSEQEKKMIEEEECSVILAQELVSLEEQRGRLEGQIETQSRCHAKQLEELQEWMEDAVKMRAEQDRRAEELRMQEHSALIKSGLTQQAERLEAQIRALRESSASTCATDSTNLRRMLEKMDRNHTENMRALRRQHGQLTESIMRAPRPSRNRAGGLLDVVMLGVSLLFSGPKASKKCCC